MGGLTDDDGDGNENGKVVGLDKQKNNFVSASRFFLRCFAVTVRLWRETS